jgi:hypothetical protein
MRQISQYETLNQSELYSYGFCVWYKDPGKNLLFLPPFNRLDGTITCTCNQNINAPYALSACSTISYIPKANPKTVTDTANNTQTNKNTDFSLSSTFILIPTAYCAINPNTHPHPHPHLEPHLNVNPNLSRNPTLTSHL